MSIEYMMIIKADNGFTMRKGQTRREVLHGMYAILSGSISGYSTNLLAKGQAMPHLPIICICIAIYLTFQKKKWQVYSL